MYTFLSVLIFVITFLGEFHARIKIGPVLGLRK